MAPRGAGVVLMGKHLRFAGLQRRTIRAYRLSVERFLTFVDVQCLPLRTQKHLDFAVSEYVNALYQEGDSLAQAGHLLSGLKRFYPEWRLKLPTASQYIKNWQKIHRPERAIPISWDLMQGLCGLCLHLGEDRLALMLYVGFFCFLRTSEMLSLQLLHVIPHHKAHRLTIIIPYAKTSEGNPQVVTCTDSRVFALAARVKQEWSPEEFLWKGTPSAFRLFWHGLLEVFNFSGSDYTPYGIRRGGATWFFLETASMDATLHRGRWSCSRTARMYIDQGTLAMAKFFWSRRQKSLVQNWALKGARYFQRLRQENAVGIGRFGVFPGGFPFFDLFSFPGLIGKWEVLKLPRRRSLIEAWLSLLRLPTYQPLPLDVSLVDLRWKVDLSFKLFPLYIARYLPPIYKTLSFLGKWKGVFLAC